jgi:hypothetical protein
MGTATSVILTAKGNKRAGLCESYASRFAKTICARELLRGLATSRTNGNFMSRLNVDPLFTFPDGSHLVISTQYSKEGNFSCALYNVLISADDRAAYRIVSTHLEADTCLRAQGYAYEHAVQLYPRTADKMKKPPYLIWHGPNA